MLVGETQGSLSTMRYFNPAREWCMSKLGKATIPHVVGAMLSKALEMQKASIP